MQLTQQYHDMLTTIMLPTCGQKSCQHQHVANIVADMWPTLPPTCSQHWCRHVANFFADMWPTAQTAILTVHLGAYRARIMHPILGIDAPAGGWSHGPILRCSSMLNQTSSAQLQFRKSSDCPVLQDKLRKCHCHLFPICFKIFHNFQLGTIKFLSN